jgi:hypothetical protein
MEGEMSQFMVTNTLDDGAGSLRSQTSQPDVDAAGGQYGRTITWTYQVTNTGSADAPAPKPTGADTTDQDFALIISNANVYNVDGDGQGDLVARALDEHDSFNFDEASSSGPITTRIESVTSNEPVNGSYDGLGGSSDTTGWFRYQTVDPSDDDGFMTKPVDTSAAVSGTPIKIYLAPSDPSTDDDDFALVGSADGGSQGGAMPGAGVVARYQGPGDTNQAVDPVVGGDGADRDSAPVASGNWIWNVQISPASLDQPITWTYTVNNTSSADLDPAASTADAAAFIDEHDSFNFDDASSSGPIIGKVHSVTSNEPVNGTDDGLGGSGGTTGWFRSDTTNPDSLDQALALDPSADGSGGGGGRDVLVGGGDGDDIVLGHEFGHALGLMHTLPTAADTGETAMSSIGTGRIYTITIKSMDLAGTDLELAASTADADVGDGGWLIGDGLDAPMNLIGTSDGLALTDFFLV